MIYSTTEDGERSMIILIRGTIVCVLYGGGSVPACPVSTTAARTNKMQHEQVKRKSHIQTKKTHSKNEILSP